MASKNVATVEVQGRLYPAKPISCPTDDLCRTRTLIRSVCKPFVDSPHLKQESINSQWWENSMLQMTQIQKTYRTELVETHALRELDLSVRDGEFVAVTGPSGSGKTTFLNIAGLLESFEQGTYLLDGKDVSCLSDDERSIYRNQKIGFIFQSFNLIPDLNLYDNVDVPLRYRRLPRAERKQRIEHALDTVGLASRMKHIPAQLSGGQQQRVAIARALAIEPKILFADEPTGNLDTGMAHQVMEMLQQIHADGTTIIMVTHDLDLAMRADRNIHLIDGRVSGEESNQLQQEISDAA
jgi:putative ABC transport system ATP-binding protein